MSLVADVSGPYPGCTMHDQLLLSSDPTTANEASMSAYRAALMRAGEEELARYNERRRRQAERDWELVVDATARLKQLAKIARWFDQDGPAGEEAIKTHQHAA